MRASEAVKNHPFAKVLILGASGSGKTTWAARTPAPFIALMEPQGLQSVAYAAPDSDVELIDGIDQFTDLMTAIAKGEPTTIGEQPAYRFSFRGEDRVCQTIVLDSLSELHDRLVAAHEGGKGVNWGKVQQLFDRGLKRLRDTPVHVACTCLLATKVAEDVRVYEPVLYGRAKSEIGRYFSATGIAHVRNHTVGTTYATVWAKPGTDAKPIPGLGHHLLSVHDAPGKVSLGSLALAAYGPTTPHRPEDSADFVTEEV